MNIIKRKWRRWFAIPLVAVLVAGTVLGVQMAREAEPALASGVVATSVTLTGQDTVSDYIDVQFDIAWNYSWRDETNWDAVWVFVKYRLDGQTDWYHATLSSTDGNHSVTTNNGVAATIDAASDGTGVFMHRSSNGSGNNDWDGVKLRWNYGTDGLADTSSLYVSVFAIEMVYIPQGSFVLHSGTSANLTNEFTSGNTISSEGLIAENTIQWNMDSNWGGALDNTGSAGGNAELVAGYPKGYQAFYMMKYEMSQRQYAEFLNTLTETQQKTLTGGNAAIEDRTTIPDAGYWAMSGAGNGASIYRSYIKTGSYTAGSPATFIVDANDNDTGNEATDGEWTAANYVSWADGFAYADWAGLRSMTELEFVKAARGPGSAGEEYAWGDTTLFGTDSTGDGYTITPGTENTAGETVDNSATLGNAVWRGTVYSPYSLNGYDGPLRVGIFADADSDRREAGASYYGAIGMSGNLGERVVTVAKYANDGSTWNNLTNAGAFDGQHGDGVLTAAGYADVANWPSPTVTGAVYTAYSNSVHGGSWTTYWNDLIVSQRGDATYPNARRDPNVGFRLARTE